MCIGEEQEAVAICWAGKCWLDIRKTFFPLKVVQQWNRCQEMRGNLHRWRCSVVVLSSPEQHVVVLDRRMDWRPPNIPCHLNISVWFCDSMITAIFRLLLIFFIFFFRFGFVFFFFTSYLKNLNNQQVWCWKDLLEFLELFNEKYGEKGGMRSKRRSCINGSKTLSGNWKLMIMLRWVIKLDAVSDCSRDQVLVAAAAG